jgi:hypothetical protein
MAEPRWVEGPPQGPGPYLIWHDRYKKVILCEVDRAVGWPYAFLAGYECGSDLSRFTHHMAIIRPDPPSPARPPDVRAP